MVLLVVTLSSRPLSNLATNLNVEDDSVEDWREHARDSGLHWSVWLRVGLYLGVLGLMALKPDGVGSVVTVAFGIGVGATAAVLARPGRPAAVATPQGPADS